jgi:hypothetical protein
MTTNAHILLYNFSECDFRISQYYDINSYGLIARAFPTSEYTLFRKEDYKYRKQFQVPFRKGIKTSRIYRLKQRKAEKENLTFH